MSRDQIKSRLIEASRTPLRDAVLTMLLIWGFFLYLDSLGWYSGDPLGFVFLISMLFGVIVLYVIAKSGKEIAKKL